MKLPVSDIRKRYIIRLVCRCIILVFAAFLVFTDFAPHDILRGLDFFRKVSWLHALWVIWMLDMAAQLFPIKKPSRWVLTRSSGSVSSLYWSVSARRH